MDRELVGQLIYSLRKEKGMTQKEIADALHISDKTISKWERGLGLPDISLLQSISELFGVNIEKLLEGQITVNENNGGNMKRIKFYVCPNCGDITTSTGNAEVHCCDRKLSPLPVNPAEEEHNITVTEMDGEYYVSVDHPMTKEHFITFIACVTYDRILLIKLYPEQESAVRLPRMSRGKIYICCSQHGIWEKK